MNPFKPSFTYIEAIWALLLVILFCTFLAACATYDPCSNSRNMSCMSAEKIEKEAAKWIVTPSGAGQKTKVTLQ